MVVRTLSEIEREEAVVRLNRDYSRASAFDVLSHSIKTEFPGKVCVVSSFGTESALLLHIVAQVDPNVPVFFLDTRKHFPETDAYVGTLTGALLSLVRLSSIYRNRFNTSASLKRFLAMKIISTFCRIIPIMWTRYNEVGHRGRSTLRQIAIEGYLWPNLVLVRKAKASGDIAIRKDVVSNVQKKSTPFAIVINLAISTNYTVLPNGTASG